MEKYYTLKKISGNNTAVYDGENRLTDAELNELFDTAGEAKFEFDYSDTSMGYWMYIKLNDDSTNVLSVVVQMPIVAGKDYIIKWDDKPASGQHNATSFTRPEGKTLTDSQLSFLMAKIKEGGGIPTDATFWGTSYNSGTNKVVGDIISGSDSSSISLASSGSTSITSNKNYIYINRSSGSNSYGIQLRSKDSGGILVSISGKNSSMKLTSTALELGDSSALYPVKYLADPTDPQDAATKNYVDTHGAVAFPTETFNEIVGA